MELIKELGSRTITSSSGKTDTRKWGLFKCPSCSSTIELKMYKGINNNTCGNSGCRKRASNAYSSGTLNENIVNNLPHHSSFRDFYNRLPSTTWGTLSDFRDDMYNSYAKLKGTEKKVTLFIKDNNPLSKFNCYWVPDKYIVTEDFSGDIAAGRKHSLMLAKETGVQTHIITRTIKKMDDTFGDSVYEVLACPGNLSRMYKAYTLSEYQYNRLRDRVLDNIKRTVSSDIYLIKGSGSVKVGMTNNVTKRFKTLTGGSPVPLTLLYSKEVPNASKVERYLHKKYSEFNHHHEWFNLTTSQIKEITDYLDTL